MFDEGGGGTAARSGVLSIADQTDAEGALIGYLVPSLEAVADHLRAGARPADCRALRTACRLVADELGVVMAAERAVLFPSLDRQLGSDALSRTLATQHRTIDHLTAVARRLSEGLDASDDERRRSCRGCLKELTVALLVHRHLHEEAVNALAFSALAAL